MKKIKISESQYSLIRLLKENIDFAEKTKSKLSDLKKRANKLYSLLTFSTIAEVIDGDLDIGIIEIRLEKMSDEIHVIDTNITNYFNRFDEKSYYAKKLDEIHSDLEDRSSTVYWKIDTLEKITRQIKPFSKDGEHEKLDSRNAFNDITTTEI